MAPAIADQIAYSDRQVFDLWNSVEFLRERGHKLTNILCDGQMEMPAFVSSTRDVFLRAVEKHWHYQIVKALRPLVRSISGQHLHDIFDILQHRLSLSSQENSWPCSHWVGKEASRGNVPAYFCARIMWPDQMSLISTNFEKYWILPTVFYPPNYPVTKEVQTEVILKTIAKFKQGDDAVLAAMDFVHRYHRDYNVKYDNRGEFGAHVSQALMSMTFGYIPGKDCKFNLDIDIGKRDRACERMMQLTRYWCAPPFQREPSSHSWRPVGESDLIEVSDDESSDDKSMSAAPDSALSAQAQAVANPERSRLWSNDPPAGITDRALQEIFAKMESNHQAVLAQVEFNHQQLMGRLSFLEWRLRASAHVDFE
ncbi:hypothetical protein CDD80_6619 [Ophiocordyceps camponoti-rufipedis]|uniref:Uncharacterized protein n=1 Tax=Ophiocordyceps camponoti-rufipedis TaxID=2004952 RepID=A0A2C5XUM3_9HYPO|nr:hypothetical protein CDD80_6619 [Ophiocordyceps camponoti-rufipedis]